MSASIQSLRFILSLRMNYVHKQLIIALYFESENETCSQAANHCALFESENETCPQAANHWALF